VEIRACPVYPVVVQVGGYWSSGLPYLDVSFKGTKRPWEAGLQLPLLSLNISDLQVWLNGWMVSGHRAQGWPV